MKSDDGFSFVKNKPVIALECINSSHVRNELKLQYLLGTHYHHYGT